MVPDCTLYNICMYVSYFDLDELFVTLHVSDLLRAKIKKLIYSQRIKVTDDCGYVKIRYTLEDRLHREDGPALIHYNGSEEYYIDDKLHRENKPALIRPNGSKEWYNNDRLHRLDGPAMENANGSKEYFIHGKKYKRRDYLRSRYRKCLIQSK